ncbi:MAG: hypothetical protein NVS1B11_19930 [Terriglobales bacterium]
MHYVLFVYSTLLSLRPRRLAPKPTKPNSVRNLYDAFGYEGRGTTLDWGFSALVLYNGKTILFDSGNDADTFEHNVKALDIDVKRRLTLQFYRIVTTIMLPDSITFSL